MVTIMNKRFAHLNLEALHEVEVMCPIAKCDSPMTPLEMLTHLLMAHHPNESMVELTSDKPTQYEVVLDQLTPGWNHAIGVIAYAGTPKTGLSTPVTADLQIVHQLPIILMLYVGPAEPDVEQAYIFYLVSPVTSNRVNAEICLLDGNNVNEMQGLRCLRNFLDTPPPENQTNMYCNTDYLLYPGSEVLDLCLAEEPTRFCVRIVLHGEPNLFEVD